MNITETNLPCVFLLEPKIFGDARGFFFESFNQKKFFQATGIEVDFVQDNQSFSKYGVLRGLHFQTEPYAQAKLVRVLKGKVLDVAVDIRKGSPHYGQYVAVELSDANQLQMFIPRGFAHGFVVLSDEAEFFYKCDNYYAPGHESGIIYNDPTLKIDWQIPVADMIVSDKDKILAPLSKAENNFVYSNKVHHEL